MTKKPKIAWVGSTPITQITAKERREIAKRIEKQQEQLRKTYPEVHGKVVDFGILPAQSLLPLLAALSNLPAFFSGDSRHDRSPAPLTSGASLHASPSALAALPSVVILRRLRSEGQRRPVAAIPASCVLPRGARRRYTRRRGLATSFRRRAAASRSGLRRSVRCRPGARQN